MPVKIRLTRMGKKKQPSYRVVVMDSRQPRDGKYIEQIGRYDPLQDPSVIEIDQDRANLWLARGAQPTERVAKLLEATGAMTQHKVASGKIHTVGEGAVEETEAAPAPVAAAPPADMPGEIHVVGGDAPADEDVEETAATDTAATDEESE
ncbi:MAG: 30S ribosomal protein S16 [Acidimicrobiia bacterium]|nr:30S ribosomal protein S16 [Acidimicrobiia bacterium]